MRKIISQIIYTLSTIPVLFFYTVSVYFIYINNINHTIWRTGDVDMFLFLLFWGGIIFGSVSYFLLRFEMIKHPTILDHLRHSGLLYVFFILPFIGYIQSAVYDDSSSPRVFWYTAILGILFMGIVTNALVLYLKSRSYMYKEKIIIFLSAFILLMVATFLILYSPSYKNDFYDKSNSYMYATVNILRSLEPDLHIYKEQSDIGTVVLITPYDINNSQYTAEDNIINSLRVSIKETGSFDELTQQYTEQYSSSDVYTNFSITHKTIGEYDAVHIKYTDPFSGGVISLILIDSRHFVLEYTYFEDSEFVDRYKKLIQEIPL